MLALAIICSLSMVIGCKQNQPIVSQKQKQDVTPKLYTMTAPKNGTVVGLIAEKGERISKGQPLFAIKDENLVKNLDKIAAEIATAEAKLQVMKNGKPINTGMSLSTLQSRLEKAQQNADKMQRLFSMGAVSRKQAEAAQAELRQATQALAAAQQATKISKPASPEEQEAQAKQLEALKESKQQLVIKLQSNEVLCPATCIVKEVKIKNGAEVKKEQPILILEESKE